MNRRASDLGIYQHHHATVRGRIGDPDAAKRT
jgi:hypothetical protein